MPHRSALPSWSRVLVVVAHPDDESFGLGAVIDLLTRSGAQVRVLCYTRGEASTVNEIGASLHRVREGELRQAGAVLGVTGVDLLDYGDGCLAAIPEAELSGQVLQAITSYRPDGLLVFDDTGITGHPDHQAATKAAVRAARTRGLPVLAWSLPREVADQLREETRRPFAGQPPDRLDISLPVDRSTQRRAAAEHVSQAAPTSVLWRRLELLGDYEHLRWLSRPGG